MYEPCALIQDLLPLYRDGVCSDESRKAVEAHLKGLPRLPGSPCGDGGGNPAAPAARGKRTKGKKPHLLSPSAGVSGSGPL